MNPVPSIRIQKTNHKSVNPKGDFVLYWMIAYRRVNWNYSLQRAVQWALELKKPLLILEALRCNYQWASERFHGFILNGMAENMNYFRKQNVVYYPYVELTPDTGKGLIWTLSKNACVVITDNFPCFFIPRMVTSASKKIPVLAEMVDSNGILPIRAAQKVFLSAYAFRRFLQKHLPDHLLEIPEAESLKGVQLSRPKISLKTVTDRWPPTKPNLLKGYLKNLGLFPLDHNVKQTNLKGGYLNVRRLLRFFINDRLGHYGEKRNEPEKEWTSGLSPYLHFGHISSHEVFLKIMEAEGWFINRLSDKATGSKTGWWGVGESAEAFLDQLITWRELGFNMCWQQDDYDRYESLPEWALSTLKAHEVDEREYIYSLEEFEAGQTHDPLWNAAQMQLVQEGKIHNYLRMLWGKKILEWSANPREALDNMIELNNKYALDGRDPNSYTGIFWVLGRYDRPWGPERPIFGKIRYMSTKNTARKVQVKKYIKKYAP